MIENITYDEIQIGQSARLVRTLTADDIKAFAAVSGDTNPAHMDIDFAKASLFHEVIGHGMWSGSLISTVLGTQFPGPGTIYYSQTLQFKRPVKVGDTLTILITAIKKNDEKKKVTLDCLVTNQHLEKVVTGEAVVLAPTEKVKIEIQTAPHIHLFDSKVGLNNLLALVEHLSPIKCAVVHPCDKDSLFGAIEAANYGLIIPILVGPENKIRDVAKQMGVDLGEIQIIPTFHSHHAAEIAAEMAAAGQVEALMKGSLHTNELMHAVIAKPSLRTKYRLSHIFRFEAPLYPKPLLITDAAININPILTEKRDIVQNAINLFRILDERKPKVAILSAVENIDPNIPSTIEAAALCKMADRGQIIGGILDGPLAFDNAISPEAVMIKKIHSQVAGDADILVVPNLEAGNMLAKQLEYLGGATACGIVMGSRVPIALTSRADGSNNRIASAILVKLVAHHYRSQKP
jgi:phosphate acetyltransferase